MPKGSSSTSKRIFYNNAAGGPEGAKRDMYLGKEITTQKGWNEDVWGPKPQARPNLSKKRDKGMFK